jgi:hypothetical protein
MFAGQLDVTLHSRKRNMPNVLTCCQASCLRSPNDLAWFTHLEVNGKDAGRILSHVRLNRHEAFNLAGVSFIASASAAISAWILRRSCMGTLLTLLFAVYGLAGHAMLTVTDGEPLRGALYNLLRYASHSAS